MSVSRRIDLGSDVNDYELRKWIEQVYATHAEFERYHVNDASCMSHVHAKRASYIRLQNDGVEVGWV